MLGNNAGSRVLTLRNPLPSATPSTSKPFTVASNGFSFKAAVSCQPHQPQQAGTTLPLRVAYYFASEASAEQFEARPDQSRLPTWVAVHSIGFLE